MSLDGITSSIAAALAVITGIFGNNLWSRHIKTSNELAVAQYVLDKTQSELKDVRDTVARMNIENAVVQSKLATFDKAMAKLELIPDIAAELKATASAVRTLTDVVNSLAANRPE
jgi:HAMP domain-containing protein